MTQVRKNLKNKMIAFLAALMIFASMPGAAYAASTTVYFKGDAVNWDYGRTWGVYSYSQVQTHKYDHSATANSTWSGWKKPGTVAYASQFVGTSTARAYWDCK